MPDNLIENTARLDIRLPVGGRRLGQPSVIAVNGQPVRVVGDCYGRPWFECPLCQGRARHIYLVGEHFGCRTCLKLRYTSRYCSVMTARVLRIMRLRRLLPGAEPHVFGSIQRVPRGRERIHRIIRRVREEEGLLLAGSRKLTDAAERRLARSQSAGSTAPAKRKRSAR